MKRIISFILCIMLLASVFTLNASASVGVVGNYPDVVKGAWYFKAVEFCVNEGYMRGYTGGAKKGMFGTTDNLQRQDFVLILANLAEVNFKTVDASAAVSRFSDVTSADVYYAKALAWGAVTGVVGGYNNGKFGVGDPITREQICTFIYRYLEKSGRNTEVTQEMMNKMMTFKDANSVSDYAKGPVAWCISKGVIGGTADGYLKPKANALRCEIAQIVYSSCNNRLFNSWMDI